MPDDADDVSDTAADSPMAEGGFIRPRSEKIIIPRQHGQLLIEPNLTSILKFLNHSPAAAAHAENASSFWARLRLVARRELLNCLGERQPAPERLLRPWIVTGHQVEFYHAGVWAKVLLADELARSTGGVAIDILVDHDTVDHLGFATPEQATDAPTRPWKKVWHTWAPASAVAADGLPTPTAEVVGSWQAEIFSSMSANQEPESAVLKLFFQALRENSCRQYAPWMGESRGAVERAFGLEVHHVYSGGICGGAAWLAFVLQWVKHAEQWVPIYNAAIEGYRKRHKIRANGRPMPPLVISSAGLELPFWGYRPGLPRERLMLRWAGGRHLLVGETPIFLPPAAGGDEFSAAEALSAVLRDNHVCLRPRALTLTLFVRSFISDLFIHGIGGAMYDEMTDQIAAAIGMPIGSFVCCSAGWLLPVGQRAPRASEPLSALLWQRHHLRHNPQLIPGVAADPALTALLSEREQLVRDLRAPRRKYDAAGRRQRHELFVRLGEINRQCVMASGALVAMDKRIAESRQQMADEMALTDREYFFALHPWASLKELQARIASAEGSGTAP